MHPTLARQLRRLCGIEGADALVALAHETTALSGSGHLSPALSTLLAGLPQLLGRVDRTYEQYERDLELRYRSLELSSSELIQANERIRQELAGRDRVLTSLRAAAATLIDPAEQALAAPVGDDLETLAALLPALAAQQDASRRELDGLRLAIDQHAIVSVTDTAGRILSVNDKFCEISGYSREELLGRDHRIINSGHHQASFFAGMWHTIQRGQVWHGEIRNRAKDGRIYWVDATIVPFLDARGQPVRYVAARTEITALKEMEAAQGAALSELRELNARLSRRERELQASESRMRALVENLLEGLVVFRPDFVIEDLNPAAERIYGYQRHELLGQSLTMLLPRDEQHQDLESLAAATRDAFRRTTERLARRKNGEVFPVEVQLYEVETPDGRLLAAHVRDLSERHAVDRLKKQFISTVSHELRTPLTSLRGSLGLLTLGAMGDLPAEARQLLALAERNTVRLVALINDILDLERLGSGQLAMELRPTSIADVMRRAIDAVAGLAEQLGVIIVPPDDDATVVGDADRLVQVGVNLLSNAIRFSPAGGRITTVVRHGLGHARVEVRDQGPGVPVDYRDVIFEPFRQVSPADSRTRGGTGLGLAICRAILDRHGGEIGVGEHEGPGATFWFALALARSGPDIPSEGVE